MRSPFIWTHAPHEPWRIDVFKLRCWERFFRVPWTAKRSSQSILKEINPEYSLEGLILNLKLQYFGHLSWLIGKDPDAGKDSRQEEKGLAEDEMVGWHHRLNGHEFKQTPGGGKEQGGLECCSPWGYKELDTTERLKNSNNNPSSQLSIHSSTHSSLYLSLYLYAVQHIVITWSIWSEET